MSGLCKVKETSTEGSVGLSTARVSNEPVNMDLISKLTYIIA